MSNIHFLHIPKTGGTAFKRAFISKGNKTGINLKSNKLILNGHGFTFDDAVGDTDSKCVFFVRNVVTRFVSGFNSRLRMGQPFTTARWDEGETVAFKKFRTPNALAEALSDIDINLQRAAKCAMSSIWHTRFPLYFWLHSVDYLEKNKDRILYIGNQEDLDADFIRLKTVMKLENIMKLPTDDVNSHKTPPEYSTFMSALAKENIRNWYREDHELLSWCEEYRRANLGGYQNLTVLK